MQGKRLKECSFLVEIGKNLIQQWKQLAKYLFNCFLTDTMDNYANGE